MNEDVCKCKDHLLHYELLSSPFVSLQSQCVNTLLLELLLKHVFMCVQDLYTARSDLGNLLKALGRLDEAKVCSGGNFALATLSSCGIITLFILASGAKFSLCLGAGQFGMSKRSQPF